MFSMKRLYKMLVSRLNNFLKLVAEGERNHINIWKSCVIYSDLRLYLNVSINPTSGVWNNLETKYAPSGGLQ